MKKRIYAVLFAAVLFFSMALGAFALDISPTDDFFVNDFASVISDDAEAEIMAVGKQLQKDIGAQIVVVTVESIGDEEIRQCAWEIAEKWGIGDKDKDNGVLIFFALKERKYSIEIGYGLEGAIPDITSSKIQENVMTPYFKKDDFSSGMLAGYRKIAALIYSENGKDMPEVLENEDISSVKNGNWYEVAGVVVILIVVIIFMRKRRRGVMFFGGFPGSRGGDVGGFTGGNFGGGGGGFSGGGGSFGGGGSSGSF